MYSGWADLSWTHTEPLLPYTSDITSPHPAHYLHLRMLQLTTHNLIISHSSQQTLGCFFNRSRIKKSHLVIDLNENSRC